MDPSLDQAPSGFDMAPTLAWYQANQPTLLSRLSDLHPNEDVALPRILDKDHPIGLTRMQVLCILSAFPHNARVRSRTRQILGMPPTWFHRDSTSTTPKPTINPTEALSPTAIIPSYIDWKKIDAQLAATISLYQIPPMPDQWSQRHWVLEQIVGSQGLAHEWTHGIISPLIYNGDKKVCLLDGRVMTGDEVVQAFADLTERLPPMSHYSGTYRTPDGRYPDPSQDRTTFRTAINEEMAESGAARALGFVYCADGTRRFDPFKDRPEVRAFLDEVLNAEEIAA